MMHCNDTRCGTHAVQARNTSCTATLVKQTSQHDHCHAAEPGRTPSGGHFGCYNRTTVWTAGGCSALLACGGAHDDDALSAAPVEVETMRWRATCGPERNSRQRTFVCACVRWPDPQELLRRRVDEPVATSLAPTDRESSRARMVTSASPHSWHVIHEDGVPLRVRVAELDRNTSNWMREPKHCQSRRVGKHYGGHDVIVAVCNASATPENGGGTSDGSSGAATDSSGIGGGTGEAILQAPSGLALCVPALYSNSIDSGASSDSSGSSGSSGSSSVDVLLSSSSSSVDAKLLNFFAHYRGLELGVLRFFVYACDEQSAGLPALAGADTTVVLSPWCMTAPLLARGQNFQLNDCVHRAAAAGIEWVLFCDVDELLVARPGYRLRALLANRKFDVYSFGALRVWRWPNGSIVTYRTDCSRPNSMPRDLCIAKDGHRKMLVRARRVWAANIHEIPVDGCRDGAAKATCANPGTNPNPTAVTLTVNLTLVNIIAHRCRMTDVSTLDAWMYHYSGVAFVGPNGTVRTRSDHVTDHRHFQEALAKYRKAHNLTIRWKS